MGPAAKILVVTLMLLVAVAAACVNLDGLLKEIRFKEKSATAGLSSSANLRDSEKREPTN